MVWIMGMVRICLVRSGNVGYGTANGSGMVRTNAVCFGMVG